MIYLTHGNLLEANVDALVNAVNCVGVMGKGIALQFKKTYPENFIAYKNACDKNEVQPGKMFIFKTNNKFIINFPTKRHWKDNSNYNDIALGLKSLVNTINNLKIQSIAIPPLGCGLGGLDWNKVKNMIEHTFENSNVKIMLYEPIEN